MRGTEALKEFSNWLLHPFTPEDKQDWTDKVTELEQQVQQLTQRCRELEQQLAAKG